MMKIFSEQSIDAIILVIDDNSPDQTAEKVKELMSEYSKLDLLFRTEKEGLGKAYIAGFQHAISKYNPEFIFEMDADFSHDPKEIPNFLKAIEDSDLVLGSRYIKGVNVINW